MDDFGKVVERIQAFQTDSLRSRIADLENQYQEGSAETCIEISNKIGIDDRLLDNAFQIKSVAGQINVIIHTIGILLSLPHILAEDEIVQSLSLGAGSTGRRFDLETNRRVAEFKFIQWQGGSEAIRQNQLFKDFYNLAEFKTNKTKYMYVLGKEIPIRFFNGNRALSSVFSKNTRLWRGFQEKYGRRFSVVKDYYSFRKDDVQIIDLCEVIPLYAKYR
jgi:hypothetical protein